MIIEKIDIKQEEKLLLKNVIGCAMAKVSSDEHTNFIDEFIWELHIDCGDICLKIEREDIIAKFFSGTEDGGLFKISRLNRDNLYTDYEKTIHRVVRGVSIVIDTFYFERQAYSITYPKAILFHFDDCNLIVEKLWLFSLAGFIVHLEPLDAENFGLCDELSFWYAPDDPEVFPEKPIFTQTIEKL